MSRAIEASSVHVETINTTFHASAGDEEDVTVTWTLPVVVSQVSVLDVVTAVPDYEEFILQTGARELRVEVDAMPHNPPDDEGFQKILPGGTVVVTGRMNQDFLEGGSLVADTVVTVRD